MNCLDVIRSLTSASRFETTLKFHKKQMLIFTIAQSLKSRISVQLLLMPFLVL